MGTLLGTIDDKENWTVKTTDQMNDAQRVAAWATVREMVARVMKESHGAANPAEVEASCQRLKDEAGT